VAPFSRLLPSLTILTIVLLGALPWGQGHNMRFLLPAAPFMAIHFWTCRHPEVVAAPFVFFVGLVVDLLTSGPLGFWPLVFLCGFAVTRMFNRLFPAQDDFARWRSFVAASSIATSTAWLIASFYFLQLVDWRPMLGSVLGQSALYPLLVWMIAPIARQLDGPRALHLERRR
jgi:rod shape-determining protein MreD